MIAVLSEASTSCPGSALFFLDWDDTLFPTSWLGSKTKFRDWQAGRKAAHEVLDSAEQALMNDLDNAARAFVVEAHSQGKVVCVTLAQPGWVERTMEAFLPKLASAWRELAVEVRYASQEKVKAYNSVGQWLHLASKEQRAMVTHVHIKQKQRSMLKALRKFYGEDSWTNVLSIGDGVFEQCALQEIGFEHENPMNTKTGTADELFVKTVKLLDDPLAAQLCHQFQVLQAWIPRMVAWRGDFDLDLGCDGNIDKLEEKPCFNKK